MRRDLATLAVAIEPDPAIAAHPTPRPRRPLPSSVPDHHTGTAAAKFHDERDILAAPADRSILGSAWTTGTGHLAR